MPPGQELAETAFVLQISTFAESPSESPQLTLNEIVLPAVIGSGPSETALTSGAAFGRATVKVPARELEHALDRSQAKAT